MSKAKSTLNKANLHDISCKIISALHKETESPLGESAAKQVQNIIAQEVNKILADSDFYRAVSGNMEHGLRNIYEELKSVKQSSQASQNNIQTLSIQAEKSPHELFEKASNQLDEVLIATENATVKILDLVEGLQDMSHSLGKIVKDFETGGVSKENRLQLKDIHSDFNTKLNEIMVSLSFQDITGQRIKIIINALKSIENIVKEMIVSTGLMIETKETTPELNITDIKKQAKEKASVLEGPCRNADQAYVDDMLAKLGL